MIEVADYSHYYVPKCDLFPAIAVTSIEMAFSVAKSGPRGPNPMIIFQENPPNVIRCDRKDITGGACAQLILWLIVSKVTPLELNHAVSVTP
jgi:hypothetical protein